MSLQLKEIDKYIHQFLPKQKHLTIVEERNLIELIKKLINKIKTCNSNTKIFKKCFEVKSKYNDINNEINKLKNKLLTLNNEIDNTILIENQLIEEEKEYYDTSIENKEEFKKLRNNLLNNSINKSNLIKKKVEIYGKIEEIISCIDISEKEILFYDKEYTRLQSELEDIINQNIEYHKIFNDTILYISELTNQTKTITELVKEKCNAL
jgi:uncharacterized coiled-coil DUF342 family protein